MMCCCITDHRVCVLFSGALNLYVYNAIYNKMFLFVALNLLIIPASRPNSDAQDMTSWLRNTTLSAPQFDTLTNNSGLILTRLKNGLVLRLSTGTLYNITKIISFLA